MSGKSKSSPEVKIPAWYEDPYYGKTQEQLYGLGTNLISGNIPDYYKSIGEAGGKEFEDMFSLLKGDVEKSVTADLAKRGVRGGLGAGVIAKSVGDLGRQLRYADFERVLTGKQNLLTLGTNTLGGVRSSALDITGARNNFNLNTSKMQYESDLAKKQAEDAMWMTILSSGIGALGTVAGGIFGGPGGAAVGSQAGNLVRGSAGGTASSITGGVGQNSIWNRDFSSIFS